jgi:hypothetical protein
MLTVMLSATVMTPRAADPAMDLWTLARQRARELRISTLITADQVARMKDDAGVQRGIAWCKEHGITRVYVETYRDKVEPSDDAVRRTRDGFRAAGILVSGCITPTQIGKASTGWNTVSCYTDAGTRRETERIYRRAAGFFDEVMIDDFLFTDCRCEACGKARADRPWMDYRRDLMLDVSRKEMLAAARAVNPRCRLIVKYPCWHEDFQERGYDVVRQTEAFDKTWVGTETRGGVPNSGWPAEPQYRAYWLMRWLGGIGGPKCGGGWFDWLGTDPTYYLEQARMTVLGGAREAMLFNFGALMQDELGKRDVAAWRKELPLHFDLARLIAGRTPRGLLGWKPPNSPPGNDRNLHALLGMAGFPVVAAHRFDASAPGFVFGMQTQADAQWRKAWRVATVSGRAVVASADFGAAAPGSSGAPVVTLPANRDANRFDALADMPQSELDALRDRATASLGVRFHAAYGVGLFLFGSDTVVLQSFRDEPTACELDIAGWKGMTVALRVPASAEVASPAGPRCRLALPSRAMVVLRRSPTRL